MLKLGGFLKQGSRDGIGSVTTSFQPQWLATTLPLSGLCISSEERTYPKPVGDEIEQIGQLRGRQNLTPLSRFQVISDNDILLEEKAVGTGLIS
jgi:hypothetical protein